MIIPSKTKIMIIPDFGVPADDEAMVALKTAIESEGDFVVKVIDLPELVRGEHDGEELTDSNVIELSASKLEQLSECDHLIWDGSNDVQVPEVKTIKLTLKNRRGFIPTLEPEIKQASPSSESIPDEGNPFVDDEQIDIADLFPSIDDEYSDWEEGNPDAIIVFGKSAMIAGDLGRVNVFFINPEYESEWPWKKQYYADRKSAEKYLQDKAEYENSWMPTVLWFGNERKERYHYVRRYAIITDADFVGEFFGRYPGMAEVARELDGDINSIARSICNFAKGVLSFPYEEVLEALEDLHCSGESWRNEIYDFKEPVILNNFTVTCISVGVPMAIGQSCYKLNVSELDYPLPLESIRTRRELNLLRDAIIRISRECAPKKRILIVPDYFTPYNSPNVKGLHSQLKQMGYYVAVFVPGNTIEQSRQGLERHAKAKPFDQIVTLETGCLLATLVTNSTRIFVNPDWTVWEWMRLRLGEEKKRLEHRGIDNSGPFFAYYLNDDEISTARQMAERAYIKCGPNPIYSWFSEDAVESHLPEEHLKRFKSCTYVPALRLDTEEGIGIIVEQINNLLTVDSNE